MNPEVNNHESFLKLEYNLPTLNGGRYDLRVWGYDDKYYALFTERSNNKGMSVINASAQIATRARELAVAADKDMRFFELWPERQGEDGVTLEEFSEVTYTWTDGVARNPSWRFITREEVEELVGEQI